MLFSGNKVAYFILVREFVAILLIPLDLLLLIYEKKLLKKASQKSEPVILILGGSRSGTTLLYQTLVSHLPVSYLNNFNASFKHAPIAAFKLFSRFFGKPDRSGKNYFGSVAGFSGPNDGFSLWNRWLGSDRNFIPEAIDPGTAVKMKQFFNAWHGVTQKPFVNKNNRNSLCAPQLEAIFDNSFFIEIHRDPVYVVQSLVLSRRMVQGSEKIGWGVLGRDTKDSEKPLEYIEDICNQVFKVDQILAKGRLEIDPEKYFRISYESFCEAPAKAIQQISLQALGHELSPKELQHLSSYKNTNQQRLTDEEFEEITKCVQKLYGEEEYSQSIVNQ